MAHLDSVDKLKSQGNEYFQKEQYPKAIECYGRALQLDPKNPILYSNRAFAFIKIDDYFRAEQDCTQAIALNDAFDKAYFRRGIARKHLHKYKSAMQDFKQAHSLCPNNSHIQNEIDCLEVILNCKNNIRIEPLHDKHEESRSRIPLKQIPINEQGNVPEIDHNEQLQSQLYEHVKSIVGDEQWQPVNYAQFEHRWRELCSIADLKLKLEFLERMSLEQYEHIFHYPFDPDLMFDLIETISHSNNNKIIERVMHNMTNMPRFHLNLWLLPAQANNVLKNIFSKLSTDQNINKQHLNDLAKKFNVNIP